MALVHGKVQRTLPSATADAGVAPMRVDSFGSPIVVPLGWGTHAIVDEGSYWKAINPTPGTAIAQSIVAAFTTTDAVFLLRNADASKRYYMDYLRIINNVAPANATRSEGLIAIDSSSRYSSGGSSLTPVNPNMASAATTSAVCRFGALTLGAESGNVRRVSRFQLRTAIAVVYEEWLFTFGRLDMGGFNTLSGTNGQRQQVDCGPVIIGPSNDLIVHLWHPGNSATAATWEFEAGWYER